MKAGDIVCMSNVRRYYGDRPDMLTKYRRIARSKKCPFCTLDPDFIGEIVCTTAKWVVFHNPSPYRGRSGEPVRLHLLFVPKRHVTRSRDLTSREMADLLKAINRVVDGGFEGYPLACGSGFGWGLREGRAGGVTLHHLHLHLIVPRLKKARHIDWDPVDFPIG